MFNLTCTSRVIYRTSVEDPHPGYDGLSHISPRSLAILGDHNREPLKIQFLIPISLISGLPLPARCKMLVLSETPSLGASMGNRNHDFQVECYTTLFRCAPLSSVVFNRYGLPFNLMRIWSLTNLGVIINQSSAISDINETILIDRFQQQSHAQV